MKNSKRRFRIESLEDRHYTFKQCFVLKECAMMDNLRDRPLLQNPREQISADTGAERMK